MIFMAIVLLGLVSFTRLSVDLFPEIELPTISVVTVYAGASATDVEEKVTDVLEEALAVTPDLEEMSSVSRENLSIVQLQFAFGTNLDEAMADIRGMLDFASENLPDDVEDPLLLRIDFSMMPVVMLGVTTNRGDIHEYTSLIEERIENRIERLDGVASVMAMNARDTQVMVEVDRERLEDYGISLQQIAGMIQMENLTLPAGTLDLGRSTYAIRVPGEFATVEELRDVIVSQGEGGQVVYLRDVATIGEQFEEIDVVARMDGQPMLMMMVQRESGANTVDVAQQVEELVAGLNEDLPENLEVHFLMDLSDFIVHMIDNLSAAVYGGGLLVLLVTYLFLRRFRTTLIVALTIPTCLVAVFAMLWGAGYTINMISLASIAMAIGVVVDNSIVVVENIIRHVERGKSSSQAAVDGADEVSAAVSASSLTNVAIFAPIIFVGGMIGVVFNQLAFVIIVAIMLSLLVSVMLAPMLASRLVKARTKQEGAFGKMLSRPVEWLETLYGRLIHAVVASRGGAWAVIVVALVLFVGSMALTGVVGIDFMSQMDGGMLQVNVELPTGTSTEHTTKVAKRIEGIVKNSIPEVRHTFYQAGQPNDPMGSAMGKRQGSNVAMVGALVPPLSKRDRTTFEMAADIRPEIERIPGVMSIDIQGGSILDELGSGGARPLTVEVFASDNESARRAANRILEIVKSIPGTTDPLTDLLDDVPELRVKVDRQRAARLAVPMASVASAVRTGMYGHPVSRFRGGEQDVDIFLRLEKQDRQSLQALKNITVPSLAKAQIRLGNIADIVESTTPVEIRRLDGDRAIRVMSNVHGRALSEITADLEKGIAEARRRGEISENVETRFAGNIKEQQDMIEDLSVALLLAILLVYMVMAAQFESLLDPLVIMFSIPFGITGVFLSLVVTGTTLSMSSFLGMIILVGIVVNNAIVLVDYINEMRRQGMALREAITVGGSRRLRPVLMTSLTTMGGMLPLALAWGEGSEMWKPMGISVIGGLMLSMLVTLVLIPAVYLVTERWRTVKGMRNSLVPEHSPEASE